MCLSRGINTRQRGQMSLNMSGSSTVAETKQMSPTGSHSRSAVPGHKQQQPMTRKFENLSPRIASGRPSGTSDPIRARYLQSLNIPALRPSSDSSLATFTKMAHNVPQTSSRPMSDKIHHEALKRDYGQVDEDLVSSASTASSTIAISSSSSTTTAGFPTSPIPSYRSFSSLSSSFSDDLDASTSSSGQRRRSVSFDATVAVKSIPTRNEYSDRIRCHLWTSPKEMHHNAQRNTVEFASEHYDWHRAVEDADMFVNVQTGQKIHPVHYERYLHALEAKKKASSTRSSSREHFLNQSRNNAAASKVRWSHLHF